MGGWLEQGRRLVVRDRERFSSEHYYFEDWENFLDRLRENGFVAVEDPNMPSLEFVLVGGDEGEMESTLVHVLKDGNDGSESNCSESEEEFEHMRGIVAELIHRIEAMSQQINLVNATLRQPATFGRKAETLGHHHSYDSYVR